MKFSQIGATLVETLVTVAILGIAALGMAQLVSNFAELQRYVEVSMEAKQFLTEVDETVTKGDLCQQALQGQAFNPDPAASPQTVTFRVGNLTYNPANPPDQRYLFNDPRTHIRVSSITLQNSNTPPINIRTYVPSPPSVVDATRYYATLTMTLEDDSPTKPRSLRPRTFNVAIITPRAPAAPTIIKCSSDISFEDTCLEMGGSLNTSTTPATCSVAPVMEGCIPGGSYFRVNGACSAQGNPHVSGSCSCPAGYSAVEMLNYDADSSKNINTVRLITCYRCPP